ncbi:hypothetical protein IE989_16575 [Klebsiella pneumoniae]|nr:hypothetical protein [Klebsiella pneumoniae]
MIMTVLRQQPRAAGLVLGLIAANLLASVLGAAGLWRQRRADGRQPAGLGLRPAPRGGRRPYCGD